MSGGWTRHEVGDAQLEVREWGSGEPLVIIQTALTADELVPLAESRELDGWRRIAYHRRGYAGSSPATAPGSIRADAADCATLLDALGIDRAHVVGASYAGAVAMELAATEPQRIRSLVLLEPPPIHTTAATDFRAAAQELVAVRRAHGTDVALDRFMSGLVDPDWEEAMEELLPGSVQQVRADAATFFDVDVPALLRWHFSPVEATRVTCPVLHIGGSESGPWFALVREQVCQWFPRARSVVIDGAGHDLALTHVGPVAAAIRAFLSEVGGRP